MSTTVSIQYQGTEVHALLGSCLKMATVLGMTTDTWLSVHTVPLHFFFARALLMNPLPTGLWTIPGIFANPALSTEPGGY